MAKEVVFWGGTGQAKVLKEAMSYSGYELVSIVDNREIENTHEEVTLLRGRLGLVEWLDSQVNSHSFFCAVAVGGSKGRERLELLNTMQECGLLPFSIIHPTSFVSNDSIVGEGSQILANSSVCAQVKMGEATIINTAASVDHDCVLGKGVHIGPGAHLAGEITVGDYSFIGTGATVLPGITIGVESIIGAGAVVTKDVPSGVTVAGNPAVLFRAT